MNKVGVLVTFGVLAVVIAMTIVIFIPKNCTVARMEGFAGSAASPAMGTTRCPKGTRAYTDKQGNLNCCAGEVTGNFCEGAIKCTFSSSMSATVPICRPSVKHLVTEFKTDFCAQSPGGGGPAQLTQIPLIQIPIAKCEYDNTAQAVEMDSQNRLVLKKTGMCMDIYYGKTENGTPVIEYPCHDGLNQKWHVDGKRIISFMNGNKCLTVDNLNNNKLAIGDCVGASPNQRWTLTE
jgi:hypothetical protein